MADRAVILAWGSAGACDAFRGSALPKARCLSCTRLTTAAPHAPRASPGAIGDGPTSSSVLIAYGSHDVPLGNLDCADLGSPRRVAPCERLELHHCQRVHEHEKDKGNVNRV